MKTRFIPPIVIMIILPLSGYLHANEVEDALARARQERKVVMLELGSVGCIPCEQMKPVMQNCGTRTYKGRLEVIFVNVKKDREAGRWYVTDISETDDENRGIRRYSRKY